MKTTLTSRKDELIAATLTSYSAAKSDLVYSHMDSASEDISRLEQRLDNMERELSETQSALHSTYGAVKVLQDLYRDAKTQLAQQKSFADVGQLLATSDAYSALVSTMLDAIRRRSCGG